MTDLQNTAIAPVANDPRCLQALGPSDIVGKFTFLLQLVLLRSEDANLDTSHILTSSLDDIGLDPS